MANFKVAHIREQGHQLVVVFINNSALDLNLEERNSLKECVRLQGLEGEVVFVSQHGSRIHIDAPSDELTNLVASINQLSTRINKTLICS